LGPPLRIDVTFGVESELDRSFVAISGTLIPAAIPTSTVASTAWRRREWRPIDGVWGTA
jgi:hypothetical protein